jgi:hypothetical protein
LVAARALTASPREADPGGATVGGRPCAGELRRRMLVVGPAPKSARFASWRVCPGHTSTTWSRVSSPPSTACADAGAAVTAQPRRPRKPAQVLPRVVPSSPPASSSAFDGRDGPWGGRGGRPRRGPRACRPGRSRRRASSAPAARRPRRRGARPGFAFVAHVPRLPCRCGRASTGERRATI